MRAKSLPRYKRLLMPAFTELRLSHERSIMTRLFLELLLHEHEHWLLDFPLMGPKWHQSGFLPLDKYQRG